MKAAALIGALTISFYMFFLFSCSFPSVNTHHIIFEEIGEMANALSYIHVVIPINISGLTQAIHDFHEKVTPLQSGYDEKKKYTVQLEKFGGNANNPASSYALLHFCQQKTYLLELMLKDANNLQGSLNSLQTSLPRVEEQHSGPTWPQDLQVKCDPAF
jgi:hypothetical protein